MKNRVILAEDISLREQYRERVRKMIQEAPLSFRLAGTSNRCWPNLIVESENDAINSISLRVSMKGDSWSYLVEAPEGAHNRVERRGDGSSIATDVNYFFGEDEKTRVHYVGPHKHPTLTVVGPAGNSGRTRKYAMKLILHPSKLIGSDKRPLDSFP